MAVCVYNPRVGGIEEGREEGPGSQTKWLALVLVRDPVSKKQVEKW